MALLPGLSRHDIPSSSSSHAAYFRARRIGFERMTKPGGRKGYFSTISDKVTPSGIFI
jgi:hypothetical protein